MKFVSLEEINNYSTNIITMNYSIESKDLYHQITVSDDYLTTVEAQELVNVVEQHVKKSPVHNFIIDFSSVSDMEPEISPILLGLHNDIYDQEASIVFACVQEVMLHKFKQEQLHLTLNVTPTVIEAIDIISMEMLERDLLQEEE